MSLMDDLRRDLATVDAYTMAKDNALPVPLWDRAGPAIRSIAEFARQALIEPAPRPVDPSLKPDEVPGATASNAAILSALKAVESITNADLSAITPRYGARIHDLRRAGFVITVTRDAPRLYRYRLEFRDCLAQQDREARP